MPEFRRGVEAIEATNTQKSSSKFRSFCPSLFWSGNNTERYVLILTPIDEVVGVEYHSWVPVGEGKDGKLRNEDFISRKDPAIGESFDRLQDDLDLNPRTRTLGVGVDLEPTMEVVNGRQRPNGFTVSTRTYTRRDQEGNEEEVTTPNIGIIVQGPMWQTLNSLDHAQGPLEELPVKIIREGESKATTYSVIPFPVPYDLSNIVDHLDGISYLRDDFDKIIAEIESLDETDEKYDLQAAQVVARNLLSHRLEELQDKERYDTLTKDILYIPPPFSGGKPKFKAGGSSATTKVEEEAPVREKPKRKSQRDAAKSKKEDAPEPADTSEEAPLSKGEKFAALKKKLAEENAAA
jgi:hypothetical protein